MTGLNQLFLFIMLVLFMLPFFFLCRRHALYPRLVFLLSVTLFILFFSGLTFFTLGLWFIIVFGPLVMLIDLAIKIFFNAQKKTRFHNISEAFIKASYTWVVYLLIHHRFLPQVYLTIEQTLHHYFFIAFILILDRVIIHKNWLKEI